jgi:hypothetical protein
LKVDVAEDDIEACGFYILGGAGAVGGGDDLEATIEHADERSSKCLVVFDEKEVGQGRRLRNALRRCRHARAIPVAQLTEMALINRAARLEWFGAEARAVAVTTTKA